MGSDMFMSVTSIQKITYRLAVEFVVLILTWLWRLKHMPKFDFHSQHLSSFFRVSFLFLHLFALDSSSAFTDYGLRPVRFRMKSQEITWWYSLYGGSLGRCWASGL